MKSRFLLVIASLFALGVNANIPPLSTQEVHTKEETNTLAQPKESDPINVKLIYDKPIEGYIVTADWQPFEAKDCETGYITINFHNITSGKEFQYINREKFSSYHTDLITTSEDFNGYKDGDVYHIQYVTKPSYFEQSPIDYYFPFQFFDIDFDGVKELLINQYYQGQSGNYYDIFEITDTGLQEKSYPPFDNVDNMTEFDIQNKIITHYTHSGIHYSYALYYQKISTLTKQALIIPEDFDEWLKRELADFATDAPSDFHITKAEISWGDNNYLLMVKNDKWEIVKHTKSSR